MWRKIIGIVLSLSMLLAVSPVASAVESSYSDTVGHWAESQIETWSQRKIILGSEGKFRPNDSITRGEVAAIINRIICYQSRGENPFSDLSESRFYADSVIKLAYAGVTNGYEDGTFRGDQNISRQQAVVLLANAFQVPLDTEDTALPYIDSAEIGTYALPAVRAFTAKGYISGNQQKQFRPKDPITRAAFITILQNMIAQVYPVDQTPQTADSKYIVINQPDVTLKNRTADVIFVSSGVGDGTVTLDNVVANTVYVQGGGVNSVIIKGNSTVKAVQIIKQNDAVRVYVESGSLVEITHVADGCNDIILSGSFKTVSVDSSNSTTQFVKADVSNLTITGTDSIILLDKDSAVQTLRITENAANADVKGSGSIQTAVVENSSAQVSVSGGFNSGSGSSSGGSSGDSSDGDNSGNQPQPPVQTVFGLTIMMTQGGRVFAEVAEDYPLIIRTEGSGMVLAEVVETEEIPENPEESNSYIVRIHVEGQGTIMVEEIGD